MLDDPKTLRVFYSYSHADEGMRKTLGNHFAAMRDFDNPLIIDWHDRKIPPGAADLHVNTATAIDAARTDRFLRKMGFAQTGGNYVLEGL